jgi:hypothetical protein
LDIYWREAVYTVVYILNRGQLRVNHDKIAYELWYGKPTSVNHFKVFGRKCYIKRDDNNLGNFDSGMDEGIFLGYSSTKKAYKCYNLRVHKIVESANVNVDNLKTKGIKSQVDPQIDERIRGDDKESIDIQEEDSQLGEEKDEEKSQDNAEEKSPRQDTKTSSRKVQRDYPESIILGR